MPRIRLALPIGLLLLAALAPARADEAAAPRVVLTHPLAGQVFRFEVPADWSIEDAGVGHLAVAAPHADPGSAHLVVRVYARRWRVEELGRRGWTGPGAPEPDALLRNMADDGRWFVSQRTFREAFIEVGGRRMLRRDVGPGELPHVAGAPPVAPGPELRSLSAFGADRVRLQVHFQAVGRDPGARIRLLEREAARIEAIQRSLSIRPVRDLSPRELRALPTWFSSRGTNVSKRRGYYLELSAGIYLPAGWTAREIAYDPAGHGSEQGLYAVEIDPPAVAAGEAPLPVAVLVFEGLPVGPLGKQDYLRTLEPRVKGVLPAARLVETKEIDYDAMSYLASLRTRWSSPTKRTIVRTYAPPQSDGKRLVVKAYSAGGMTAAAHLIMIGEERGFAAFERAFEEIRRTLSIVVYSPSIRF